MSHTDSLSSTPIWYDDRCLGGRSMLGWYSFSYHKDSIASVHWCMRKPFGIVSFPRISWFSAATSAASHGMSYGTLSMLQLRLIDWRRFLYTSRDTFAFSSVCLASWFGSMLWVFVGLDNDICSPALHETKVLFLQRFPELICWLWNWDYSFRHFISWRSDVLRDVPLSFTSSTGHIFLNSVLRQGHRMDCVHKPFPYVSKSVELWPPLKTFWCVQ